MEGRPRQQSTTTKWQAHSSCLTCKQGELEKERKREREKSSSFTLVFNLQCDLANEGFLGNINQLDDYCREKGFHAWFETSAKENVGIDEAARCLVAKVSVAIDNIIKHSFKCLYSKQL